jgi:hypothetical protein
MALRTIAALAAVGSICASSPVCAQVTTRIETRPVYGATVTLEHGVRVYRPLPPHDRVIINPGGKTPLVLGEYTYNYEGQPSGDGYAGDVPGAPSVFGTAPAGAILPRGSFRHRLGHPAFSRHHLPHGGHRSMGRPHR